MTPASDNACRLRPLLGTFVEIAAAGTPRSELDAAIEGAFHAVAEVHHLMSFQEPSSDVGRLNREASLRPVSVHPWTYQVLGLARELHAASAGVFDIAVATISQDAFQPRRLEDDGRSVPGNRHGSRAVELLPGHRVRFSGPGVRIDLSGIAKGFAVDRAIDILRGAGVPRGLVNAGGDLAVFGSGACVVHLRDPRNPRRLMCRLDLKNEALASSGGQFDPFLSSGTRASTVIDPSARAPARTVYGATVRAPSCIIADALTKVVMVAGESAATLTAQYGAHAMFMSADGDLRVTRDWHGAVHVAS